MFFPFKIVVCLLFFCIMIFIVLCLSWFFEIIILIFRIRGEVKDIRLEAKAKNTKKSEAKDSPTEDRPCRGQGQECSGA